MFEQTDFGTRPVSRGWAAGVRGRFLGCVREPKLAFRSPCDGVFSNDWWLHWMLWPIFVQHSSVERRFYRRKHHGAGKSHRRTFLEFPNRAFDMASRLLAAIQFAGQALEYIPAILARPGTTHLFP